MVFFVNKNPWANPHRNHEVHKTGWCVVGNLVPLDQRKDLGEQPSAMAAVTFAKQYYADADGCAICCPEAHHE